ncbi:MAG: ABC transporter permease [Dehalococcoidia bacterium]|nr:ABC transporter permease [Dehalococcoidia bacterium]
MRAYILRRLLMFVPVLMAASVLIFALMRVLPGDVAVMILVGPGGEGQASPEALAKLRADLGLDQPLFVQYVAWLKDVVQLNLGTSYASSRTVVTELSQRLPITVELAFLAIIMTMLIAVPAGVVSAIRQNTWLDYLLRVVSVAGLTIPTFFTATLLILWLVTSFRWLPPIELVGLFNNPVENLTQLIWPAVMLAFYHGAVISRMTRSQMLEVLRQDYVRTAWAKGLEERLVVVRHALQNALLPVVTIAGLEFGVLLGGTVVMETIFVLPGVGSYIVESIRARDYPVLQAIILMMALSYLVINLVVDLCYAWLDPRIRYA